MSNAAVDLRDRCLGGLIGRAVGDALGAPFEGLWPENIPDEEPLLARFTEYEGYPRGQFTDDTQLTVATLQSIVAEGEIAPASIAAAFGRLWRRGAVIGPGGACMQAGQAFLESGDWRTCGAPLGQAGNGTAMRMPLLGLWFLKAPAELPEAAADVARLTHRDPRSVAGGVGIAKAAQLLATANRLDPAAFCNEVAATMDCYDSSFAARVRDLPALVQLPPGVALPSIAWSGRARPQFERPIVAPFVVPTVLWSLWCVLRHADSWPQAVAAAIRCGGDVDTLGAIVGALAGMRLGIDAVPTHLRATVRHGRKLEALASRYGALVVKRGASRAN